MRVFKDAPKVSVPQDQGPIKVNVSGGRSSGMLLAGLLEHGQLKAIRGDFVVFNNTSAEHPATYDFLGKLMRTCRDEFGIPFFSSRYCTCEIVKNSGESEGIAKRRETYILEMPGDFKMDGSAFEEMVLYRRRLPNLFQRSCTANMKIRNSAKLWTDLKRHITENGFSPPLGHKAGRSRMSLTKAWEIHQRLGGKEEWAKFKRMFLKLSKYPTHRPSQSFGEFGGGDWTSPFPLDEHVSVIGFRADEPRRVSKMRGKDAQYQGGVSNAIFPLHRAGITKADVNRFWEMQDPSLQPLFPTNLNVSNCTYCFLKGSTLVELEAGKASWEKTLPPDLRAQCELYGPHQIQWWIDMEDKYALTRTMPPLGMTRGRLTYGKVIELAKAPGLDLDMPAIECVGCHD